MVPFLRWVGGKAKLLPTLTKLLPPNYKTRRYVEPFVGGGALFFHLEPQEALLSDLNKDLIYAYAAVREQPDKLLGYLEQFSKRHAEDQYYIVRTAFNARTESSWVHRAAWFVYLNKCCFNGVWRVNKAGEYNVPIGTFKSGPNIVNTDVIHAAHTALRGVDLLHGDFESLLTEAWEGDFIYLDPPYVPLNAESFTTYNEGGFTLDDQRRLASVYRKLHERGCMLMMSNSSAELVRELYSGFRITPVLAARSINSDITNRGLVQELVIRNYDSAERIDTAA